MKRNDYPTPWTIEKIYGHAIVCDADGKTIPLFIDLELDWDLLSPNFKLLSHIVDCVNACNNMSSEFLKNLPAPLWKIIQIASKDKNIIEQIKKETI